MVICLLLMSVCVVVLMKRTWADTSAVPNGRIFHRQRRALTEDEAGGAFFLLKLVFDHFVQKIGVVIQTAQKSLHIAVFCPNAS